MAAATAELKNDDDDELQGNSKFLPAGTCHAAAASEAAKAAAENVIQAALVSVNGATPDASDVAAAAAAADAAAAAQRNANAKQFAELLKTVKANRDDDLEIAAGMECVLKWRAVVALTPEERALAMAAAPSVDGANPAEAIEDFVRRNSTLDFDDIRAMPRPLRRHLLDARVKELATYADEDKIEDTDRRMVEAAAFAVEKCLKQTEGQVCYICLDDESAEGLVRGCACRGDNGFVHVSCLARQAHLHFGDNLAKGMQSTENDNVFVRWNNCRLCDQSFYGPVGTAIAWACLASYSSRARHDGVLLSAMGLLARFLDLDKRHDEALAIREGAWEIVRHWEDESSRIVVRGDLAQSYEEVDRFADALEIWRDLYARQMQLRGAAHERTLMCHTKVAWTLIEGLGGYEEAQRIMRDTLSIASRVLPREGGIFLSFRSTLAYGLYKNPGASLLDLLEAEATFDELCVVSRRVFGEEHPVVVKRQNCLKETREKLAVARKMPRSAVAASYAY